MLNKVCLLMIAIAIAGVAVASTAHADGTVSVESSDPVMNAAIEKARASIDTFWAERAAPAANEEGFAIKLAISDNTNTEHFWCTNIEDNGDTRSCEINNEPELVKTVTMGQRVSIDPKLISDWMYLRDGKFVGGETLRAIIPKLPPDQQEQYRAMLADN